jgi:hypothetical protein
MSDLIVTDVSVNITRGEPAAHPIQSGMVWYPNGNRSQIKFDISLVSYDPNILDDLHAKSVEYFQKVIDAGLDPKYADALRDEQLQRIKRIGQVQDTVIGTFRSYGFKPKAVENSKWPITDTYENAHGAHIYARYPQILGEPYRISFQHSKNHDSLFAPTALFTGHIDNPDFALQILFSLNLEGINA